jgi:hypothetical protein
MFACDALRCDSAVISLAAQEKVASVDVRFDLSRWISSRRLVENDGNGSVFLPVILTLTRFHRPVEVLDSRATATVERR